MTVRRRFGTAVWDMPDQKVVQVNRENAHKCPNCGDIFCTGDFGKGTVIEVKCKRCNAYFTVAAPN